MRILTTVFTSAALVVGVQAFAASDHASTSATQGSNAATHSQALQTPSRDLTRDRNPNAATPATPYPGEGKAATQGTSSDRSPMDGEDPPTSTTGRGSLSGSADTSTSTSTTTEAPLSQEQRDLLRSQRSGGMSPTTK